MCKPAAATLVNEEVRASPDDDGIRAEARGGVLDDIVLSLDHRGQVLVSSGSSRDVCTVSWPPARAAVARLEAHGYPVLPPWVHGFEVSDSPGLIARGSSVVAARVEPAPGSGSRTQSSAQNSSTEPSGTNEGLSYLALATPSRRTGYRAEGAALHPPRASSSGRMTIDERD